VHAQEGVLIVGRVVDVQVRALPSPIQKSMARVEEHLVGEGLAEVGVTADIQASMKIW